MVHDLADIFANIIFRMWMMTWGIDVGGFVKHESDAFVLNDFIDTLVVGLLVEWIFFSAPVARNVNDTIWSANYDGSVAWNGVKSVNKFDTKVFGDRQLFMFEWINSDVIHIWDFIEF